MPVPKKSSRRTSSEFDPTHALPPVSSQQNGVVDLESVRVRAYELYEKRGRQDGYAEEDWLRAEAEVLGQKRSA